VTIPIEFRRALGIEGEEVLEMTLARGELRIRQLASAASVAGRAGESPGSERREHVGDATAEESGAHIALWQDSRHGDSLC